MQVSERTLLLETSKITTNHIKNNELSLLFAIICIVDVFGVFPIVALPKAIIDCGFYGIIIVITVCSVQIYTANLLGKCWILAEKIDIHIHKKNRYPYAALAELTYGKTLSKFVCCLLDITVFGGGIPNLIVASQNLELLGLRISDNSFNMSYCYWMIILGGILCPLLWLGSPKDMKLLCSISVTLVVLVFLLVGGCLISSTSLLDSNITENINIQRPLWEVLFAAYGIISFQFDIHPSILTIQVDMRDKSNLRQAIIGGFLFSLSMFGIVTIIAGIKFGTQIKSSILETLPVTVPLDFAATFVAIQLCLSSAVSNSALYQHMEDCMQISRAFNHRRCVLRTTLILMAILIAESVPKFDLVMSLIGGTLTAPLIFILPPLFYIKMLSLSKQHDQQLAMESFTNVVYESAKKSRPSISNLVVDQFCEEFLQDSTTIIPWKKLEITICIMIVIASICATIATTYVNIKSAVIYANFSQPCIYNVSSALIHL